MSTEQTRKNTKRSGASAETHLNIYGLKVCKVGSGLYLYIPKFVEKRLELKRGEIVHIRVYCVEETEKQRG